MEGGCGGRRGGGGGGFSTRSAINTKTGRKTEERVSAHTNKNMKKKKPEAGDRISFNRDVHRIPYNQFNESVRRH